MPKKGKNAEASAIRGRPPIVAVMGHVDHGKTTLLDAIRKTKIALGEKGGITQQIGAYQVEFRGRKLTFIDTPGHEAFTAMRARGGQAADIIVLVVAADEGVKPQTKEALDHARAAGVPLVVAINKIDLPGIEVQKIKEQLAKAGVVVEDWGGKVVSVEVSAKKGTNIDNLLEMILLVAEMEELKGDLLAPLEGVVIESRLDSKKGPLATVIVRQGVLREGQKIFAGEVLGKVKALFDDEDKRVKKAVPSTPVEILGFKDVPLAGTLVLGVKPLVRGEDSRRGQRLIDFRRGGKERERALNLILKVNTQGALEALREALLRLESDEVQINFIHAATGEVTASDVLLAKSNLAIVVCFGVRAALPVLELAKESGVEIRRYEVIYELIKDVDLAIKGLLEEEVGELGAKAEVLKLFPLPSGDVVLGCRVLSGKFRSGQKVKASRADGWTFKGKVKSLKIGKEKVSEVGAKDECGFLLRPSADFKPGDILEAL